MHHDFGPAALPSDPRFPEDEFTRAAIIERHVDTHRSAFKHVVLAALGGFLFFRLLHRHAHVHAHAARSLG
jgi:hypothetical protein